ncbi:uncharacterized protein EAF02_006913 [Botrytis sinoallii]|uniref:uncharacterized protein n=1 Tax=Botrytis sinoallii TaxID=1463999 RepID=UPI0019029D8C|nr:uncharacterized protein EAF02_006913 [Botrytis sinoallii]KAF7881022.1 hypothetical protein EAF02_006913 [Botrytis sinoallii]
MALFHLHCHELFIGVLLYHLLYPATAVYFYPEDRKQGLHIGATNDVFMTSSRKDIRCSLASVSPASSTGSILPHVAFSQGK